MIIAPVIKLFLSTLVIDDHNIDELCTGVANSPLILIE